LMGTPPEGKTRPDALRRRRDGGPGRHPALRENPTRCAPAQTRRRTWKAPRPDSGIPQQTPGHRNG
jgi:hypothetical protein